MWNPMEEVEYSQMLEVLRKQLWTKTYEANAGCYLQVNEVIVKEEPMQAETLAGWRKKK